MIPPFDPGTGLLPVGEHTASEEAVVERFGWNEKRRSLLDGLAEALELLRGAGYLTVWLNGSFVTVKDEPGGFGACRDTNGVDLDELDPVFLDLPAGRSAQKHRFGGEFFPNVLEASSALVFAEVFQNERDGSHKGIVVMNLGGPT